MLARSYQGLATQGLQNVPPEWMHCTLLHTVGLGRADIALDVLLTDVARFAQTVRPFNLTFDRPAVGNFAVEVSGWPGRPFTQLVDGLTEAMARTGSAFTAAPSRFPHLSAAYASDGAEDVDAVSVKMALADIELPLAATIVADRLHLVEQWHDGAHIMWNPVATVPLGVTG